MWNAAVCFEKGRFWRDDVAGSELVRERRRNGLAAEVRVWGGRAIEMQRDPPAARRLGAGWWTDGKAQQGRHDGSLLRRPCPLVGPGRPEKEKEPWSQYAGAKGAKCVDAVDLSSPASRHQPSSFFPHPFPTPLLSCLRSYYLNSSSPAASSHSLLRLLLPLASSAHRRHNSRNPTLLRLRGTLSSSITPGLPFHSA